MPRDPAPSPRVPGSSEPAIEGKELLSHFNPNVVGFGLIKSWIEKPSTTPATSDVAAQGRQDKAESGEDEL